MEQHESEEVTFALIRNNWPLVLGLVAIVVGGAEMRLSLADHIRVAEKHMALPAHAEQRIQTGVTAEAIVSIKERLEEGEVERKEIAETAVRTETKVDLILDEIKLLRRTGSGD